MCCDIRTHQKIQKWRGSSDGASFSRSHSYFHHFEPWHNPSMSLPETWGWPPLDELLPFLIQQVQLSFVESHLGRLYLHHWLWLTKFKHSFLDLGPGRIKLSPCTLLQCYQYYLVDTPQVRLVMMGVHGPHIWLHLFHAALPIMFVQDITKILESWKKILKYKFHHILTWLGCLILPLPVKQ